ncbi:type II and III secretion system protein family protein [Alcanivorax sp. S6407]|uniref:type II and III secretion system protein family protein n=1 Tax=Alcanivorax sp. S6407 TaxID=2926424 RepID=UPI001FF6BE96|nr:type II and III secretion system protein family protein [Alcanivorax sp. S6407]
MLLATVAAGVASAAERYELQFSDGLQKEELTLSLGKSQMIYSPSPLDQVVIGNPEIADIKLLSSRHVLILGLKPGHTNLAFRDQNRNLVALMDVIVGYDMEQMKRRIYELMPEEKGIELRGSNDQVILSGKVSSVMAMEQALSVARSFASKEKVVNMLEVGGGTQVMLEVRIAEINRNSLKELGVNLELLDTDGAKAIAASTLNIPNNIPFLNAVFTDTSPGMGLNNPLRATLRALERQGLAKVLAKPNLTALSGQEASFLAGGEVAIPVAQDANDNGTATITVEYKEFGVGLKFIPTVLSDRSINIKLNAEVSAVDEANGFQASGFNIPGFVTRRTGTTVEMADGQAFAVAGLIQNDSNNVINQVPVLGSIPVLGALFRSSEYRRRESELVVIVTPRLVTPKLMDDYAMPTDVFIPPTDLDQYLLGFLEHRPWTNRHKEEDEQEKQATNTLAAAGPDGGLQGSYGHQLREVASYE